MEAAARDFAAGFGLTRTTLGHHRSLPSAHDDRSATSLRLEVFSVPKVSHDRER
jgi:hypothetical protein